MRSAFRFSLALSVCLLLVAPVVFGQTTGEIQGTVNGTDGRPLPGVTVEASSPSLQGTRVSVTGNDGVFRFISLPPGVYKVRGNLSGFTTVERTATVKLDSAIVVQMQLQVSAKEELVVTGEAPVVDSTSAESGTNIRQEIAQKLPVGRNYSSVVAIQPGVATDQAETQGRGGSSNPTGGGFTIYGATSVENSYLVDGVNTTNVIKGFQGKALSQEFIEEVQVKSSGYEPEYGRSTGGVINVVTKSGGNDFHGDAFGYFDTKGLTADYKGFSDVVFNADETNFTNSGTDAEYVVDRSQQNRQDYGADLGGFFVKDHVWFFGAYNRVTYNNSQILSPGAEPIYGPLVAGVDQQFDSTGNIYSGKLTFRLGQGTTIVGTVFGDPEKRSGNLANLSSTNPVIKNATRDLGATDYSGALTQLFGSSALVTARYARHGDRYQLNPGPGSDAPQIRDYTSGSLVVSNGFGSIFGPTNFNKSTRDAYQLTGTVYAANHEIKVGGDYENNTTFTTSFYTGGSRLQIQNCPDADPEDPGRLLCTPGTPGNIYYGHDFYTGSSLDPASSYLPAGNVANPKSVRYSAFVQDKWTVMPALTVQLGVRWDLENIKDYTGASVIKLKNEWQPRIGIAYDIAGDGSSKLSASAGRFYFAMPTDLNVRAYGAQTTATVWNYDPSFDAIFQDPLAPRLTNVQGGAFTEPVQGYTPGCGADGNPACVSSLKGIYQDEYTLGFDKAIDPTFAVGVKGTYRHYGRTIEDRCDVDAAFPEANQSTCVIFNPGSDDAFATGDFHACSGFDSEPFDNSGTPDSGCNSQALTPISQPLPAGGVYNSAVPKAKREYYAAEFVAKKQVGRSLWTQVSYIWSRLRGNYDGSARQANLGQTDPGINADFDYAAFLINADGKLYLDRPHSVRVDAAYTAPFGLTMGFSGFVRSGAPKDKVGYFNSQYGTELLLVERGSFGRLPADYEINASLGYTIKIAPVDISLFVQGFNLLNRQTVLAVDNEFSQDIPGSPDEFYGSFDKAVTRRAPRQLKFGARISF
ncbi:MAG: carboxypeptidase regulatory-like domain-containing protein [Acidobacteriota bacterium]